MLAAGAIPVTNLAKDAGPLQVLAQRADGTFADAGVVRDLRTNGRGVAAADYDDDGRVDLAVNTIGGKLILLHNTSKAGHWLEVQVHPFAPGAVVTVVGVDGRRQVREVRAGSSYLSSEDPRVHFGLGAARTVRELDRALPGWDRQAPARPRRRPRRNGRELASGSNARSSPAGGARACRA